MSLDQTSPVRLTQVAEVLEGLDGQFDRLHAAINALEGRLSCVLQDEVPTKAGVAEEMKAMVPLADRLYNERCKTANAAYRIERIIERLEL